MLTSFSLKIPKLPSAWIGLGVPKRMSVTSEEIMQPPQPSARETRSAWSSRWSGSWSTPMLMRCIDSTTSRSMLRGTIPHLRQRSWVFFGARLM